MDYNAYLMKEYKTLNKEPKLYDLGKIKFVIPAYYDNTEDFLDDLLDFQDNEAEKYERYNSCNPDKEIEPREIKLNDDIRFIVPLSMAKRNLSDAAILRNRIQKAIKLYQKAIKKNKELNDKNPDKKVPVKVGTKHISDCNKKLAVIMAKNTAIKLGRALKWSAKQTADVVIGLLSSPVFAAYKLLDKKYHYQETKFSRILDKQIAPRVKKALLTTAITASVTLGLKNSEKVGQFVEDIKTEQAEKRQAKIEKEAQIAQEKAQKEAFFKKYETTDEIFYQNYKIAKENEPMIVALIACPEGFREKAYLCEAGKPTKGYGTTRTVKRDNNGNIEYDEKGFAKTLPVVLGTKTTKEAAYEDVVAHLDKYVYSQFKHINRVLDDQEISATCMFIYNTDEGAFSESMLCKAINDNAGDKKVREAFSIIRSVNGERSYGLINRHGFEGYVFCCEGIEDLVNIKPTIAGSPDIKYYEYGQRNKRDPLENSDLTFVTRDIDKVAKDADSQGK